MTNLGTKQALEAIGQAVVEGNGNVPVALGADALEALTGSGAAAKTIADLVDAIEAASEDIAGQGVDAKTLADVVDGLDDLAGSIAGDGLAAKTLADVVTALTTLSGHTEALAGLGLPVMGVDAAGQDAYAAIVAAPNRVCRHLHVSVDANGAIISLDGGVTDHLSVPANTAWQFSGLAIPALASLRAKNLDPGSHYTNLRISVW
jgi:hypothetical protein